EIPVGALSSVEILKDGSSSIYGSDAVAGVVNILLDRSFEGFAVDTTYGNSLGRGDAKELTSWMKMGVQGERARFVASLSYHTSNETKVTDTRLGRVANVSDLGGIEQDRYFTNPANIVLADGSRVILDYRRFGPGQYSMNPADYIPYDAYDYNRSAYATRDRELFTDHAPERQLGGFAYGEFDLVPESATLFGEVLLSSGRMTTGYVTWGLDFYGDPVLDFGPVPADHPYNPFGVELRAVNYSLAEVGRYIEDYDTDTVRGVAGLKGDLGRVSYEIGATYFETEETYRAHNLYSTTGLLAAINRTGPDAFNPFGNMANTPAQLAGIRIANNEFVSTSTQVIYDARITGPLLASDSYNLDFAVGAETRTEEYEREIDPLTATGDVYYYQQSPDYQKRRSDAAFAELAYTLNGDAAGLAAIHQFTMEVSGRYESIQEVGDTFNPRVAMSWQPISDAFTVRASYGRSFKAPPINLLRADQRLVNEVLYYPELGVTLPTDLLIGGNPDLEPETAQSFNLGTLLRLKGPVDLSVTLDYFRIEQEDVVLVPSGADIVEGLFPGEVDFSGPRPRIEALPRNVAGRNVEGVDMSLRYAFDTSAAGTWKLHAAGSYLTKFEADNGAGFVSYLGKFGRYGRTTEFGSLPRLRGGAGIGWASQRGLEAEFSMDYVGGFKDSGVVRDVEAFVTYDLTAKWRLEGLGDLVRGTEVRVGVLNLTGEEPPFVNGAGVVRYDTSTAHSRGRTFFVGLAADF
ncbi:TonB-dependent receptor domain-containing protein, partial [Steroidobacter sp.]|uniref:TonB-dependent receptor domain-containing protein n=1 Tax=Steroidobacter sp. TaxID=1978227 RepID=UPI001A595CA3